MPNLPNYEDLGFNKFMERTIGSQNTQQAQSMGQLNFDQVQMSGSLGDSIQVGGGNVRIEGANKRIVINDGENDRIIIGEIG